MDRTDLSIRTQKKCKFFSEVVTNSTFICYNNFSEALPSQAFGLRPIRAKRGFVIDGFAKMPLQASIFASWYNKVARKQLVLIVEEIRT